MFLFSAKTWAGVLVLLGAALWLGDTDALVRGLDAWLETVLSRRELQTKLSRAQARSLAPLTTCQDKWQGASCVEACQKIRVKQPVETMAIVAVGRNPEVSASAEQDVMLPCASDFSCLALLDFCYVCACKGVKKAHIMTCALQPEHEG
jgi:hypothetical protein